MFKRKSYLPLVLGLFSVLFFACDKDYSDVGAEIIGDDHFGFDKYTEATIAAYNHKTGAVVSKNLPVNPFGIYENPAFGNTQANFVTQISLASPNPIFPEEFENPTEIDSVILNIPYFSHVTSVIEGQSKEYELDSIYGIDESTFKLSIYQSGYDLSDIDTNDNNAIYTDSDSAINSNKMDLLNTGDNPNENTQFFFDKRQHKTTVLNDNEETVNTYSAPSMRLHLNNEVFTEMILNAPSGTLVNNDVFRRYFRGLYFTAEDGTPGTMAMLDFKKGVITMYYKEDKEITGTSPVEYERVSKNLTLNLTGNSVSLLNNSNENLDYLNAVNNPEQEASRLYLKGGEGSVAEINLFGPDTDDNGIADEIDEIIENGWMINDAVLTFNIDQSAMSSEQIAEPNRIFLYDMTNHKTIIDYTVDLTKNNSDTKKSKYIYGGIIEKEETSGLKYRIRVTNYVRDLVKNKSKSIKLGLSVTEDINNIGFAAKKGNTGTNDVFFPSMSVVNPLGTILYGATPDVSEDKRLKLEIYYTKPN